jgi:hypothetical protein
MHAVLVSARAVFCFQAAAEPGIGAPDAVEMATMPSARTPAAANAEM